MFHTLMAKCQSKNRGEEEAKMSYRPRPRRPLRPPPVREGEEREITIQDTSRRGEGIARVEGFVIFVPGAKIGDRVKIRITRVAPRFATAEKLG
ncbi:MAG: translation initiation factor IF-2 subunit beta [Candidatus Bathyarchaeota archaeon BA1]|nr:MAG: translation initiation factor IF-2 subunit beta [Candidatus Bathyarchaeota archaeon BA1]